MLSPIPSGHYRFIAVDVETACSDVGSICQIGLACVTHADTIDCWSTLIDPDIEFSFYNTSRLLKKSAAQNGFLPAQPAAFGFRALGADGIPA